MRHLTGALIGLALILALPAGAAGRLNMPVGGEQVVDFGKVVTTFYIQNPGILDARALDDHRVILIGRAAGTSPVIAYDATGERVYTRRVHVGARLRGPSSAYTKVIVHNGMQRTSYACTEDRCHSVR